MKKEILEKIIDSKKNLIISGDISTGKTSTVLFPLVDDIISKKESLLILDSKEEYINKYYEELEKKNYNIIVLNLRDLEKSEGWNPLEYPYNLYKEGKIDETIDYIEKQAQIMFYDNSISDPYWTLTASDFYTGTVLGLFEDGNEKEININSINSMIDGINVKYGSSNYMTEYFKTKKPNSKPYIYASSTFLAPNETKASIVSVVRQKIRTYISREKLCSLLNKTTFNYNDIINKPTAIFVITKDENKCINNVATMFIEQLFAILIDLQNKNKFHFMLDNIDTLEKIPSLTDMMSSGVSRNIIFEIASRSLLELTKNYGEYLTKLSNLLTISKETKLIINNEELKIELERKNLPEINNLIKYPIIKNNKIEIFNIENFVNSKKPEYTNDKNLNSNNINNLLKEIDEKIKELEKFKNKQ